MSSSIVVSKTQNPSLLIDKMHITSIVFMTCVFWAYIDKPTLLLLAQMFFIGTSVFKILNKKIIETVSLPYIRWAFVWLLYCLFTSFWSVNFESTVSYIISVFQVLLVGTLLVTTVDNHKQVEQLEKIIILAGIILIARLWIVTPIDAWGQERLGTEMGMHVNHIATNLLISLMFTLKLAVGQRKKLYWLLVVLFLLVIVMTASKKAIIIGLLALLVIAPMGRKGIIKKITLLFFLFAAGTVLIRIAMEYPIIYEVAAKRFEGFTSMFTSSGTVDRSTAERQDLIHTAWRVFTDYPLLGVGLNGFRYFNIENDYAHNNFLELLASCGMIGFIIYYSIYFIIFKRFLIKSKKNIKNGMYLMMVFCILVMEIMQITYYLESVQFVLAVLFLLTKYGDNELSTTEILRRKMSL